MSHAAAIAARFADMELESEPWPHGIIDGFFPSDVFAELLAACETMDTKPNVSKLKSVPASAMAIMESPVIKAAIEKRFGFQGGSNSIDIAYRRTALAKHSDRSDKPWSGLVYLAGDPKGTELYGRDGKLAKCVEWKPNRLVCWSLRSSKEQHAVPTSAGRFVLVWWLLRK